MNLPKRLELLFRVVLAIQQKIYQTKQTFYFNKFLFYHFQMLQAMDLLKTKNKQTSTNISAFTFIDSVFNLSTMSTIRFS